jgi:hypothetical protein
VAPASGAVDTVAELNVAPMQQPSGSGMRPVPPYQPEDAWGVDANGRVGIVRHDPYRVDWVEPDGALSAGTPVPYEPVRLGRAERDAWLDRLAAGPGVVITQGGRSGTARPLRPDASALEWPAVLPAFEGPAWVTPDRHVWVRRNRSADSARPLFDVFDGRGRLVSQVELPAGRRVVGVGASMVYAVRQDDVGLLWLERYSRPPGS